MPSKTAKPAKRPAKTTARTAGKTATKTATRAATKTGKAPAKRPMRNRLNDLTGAQWLFQTNTLWETTYPQDATHALRKAHGAMKPPEAMRDLIEFFTKRGERVLDPFAGVGGTLLGAAMAGRQSVGIEVDPRWQKVFQTIQREFRIDETGTIVPAPGTERAAKAARRRKPSTTFPLPTGELRPIEGELLTGSCLHRMAELPDGSFHAVICDPPYGVDHGATGFSRETNFSMEPEVAGDFGAAPTFDAFYDLIAACGEEAYRLLAPKRYLVVLIGDRYRNGRFIPLGIRVADALERSGRFVLKGVRIWTNRTTLRPLRPYAIGSAFVPNITHQNVVILRRAD